jgi:hypothetical protein
VSIVITRKKLLIWKFGMRRIAAVSLVIDIRYCETIDVICLMF